MRLEARPAYHRALAARAGGKNASLPRELFYRAESGIGPS